MKTTHIQPIALYLPDTRVRLWLILLTILITILPGLKLPAQVLDSENKLTITLSDGTHVTLFGKATRLSDEKSSEYYYLPVNPRLSFRPDGVPEFLFLKFTTENRKSEGGISGALLHFLMEWGLTPEQDRELRTILESRHKAKLGGPANVEPDGENSFRIISGTLSDEGLTQSLVASGKAPVLPGSKIAVAANLDANGAQLLAASFEKARSITDLSIELSFGYSLRFPAAQGRAVVDWSKVRTVVDSVNAVFEKSSRRDTHFGMWGIFPYAKTKTYNTFSYDEMHTFMENLEENKYIEVEFDANQDDERVDKVREAFFEYFLDQMSEKVKNPQLPPPGPKEQEANPDIMRGSYFSFSKARMEEVSAKGRQEFNLNYRLAIKRSFNITGNLASWYESVRDNPQCVSSVNLNDPFFQHRDINLILDLDAKEMFDEAVNYVTVEVRKRRTSGHDFSDRVTIDKKHLEEKGVKASMTYARAQDKNPDLFQYRMQWSMKGGKLFPQNPGWKTGSWEGVTLAPPVYPRTIELEGDLDDLKENGITRVTAQILYTKFGKLEEKNIHVSPARGEPLVEQKIFLDRHAKGYAYRLIFNHKIDGKLVLDWSEKRSDDYIYVNIPEQLIDKNSQLFKQAKAAGKTLKKSLNELLNDTDLRGLGIFKDLIDNVTDNG